MKRGSYGKGQSKEISRSVREFYEEWSFPGYEEFDNPLDLVEKAKKGLYAKMLDDQIPFRVKILDVGCGTGNLTTFLSMSHRRVLGIDFSFNSLRQGQEFKHRFDLNHAHFAQMDLFNLGLKNNSFEYVFCNGVLHHTADPYGGFRHLCGLVKKGGYIVIGLYNRYGRLLLDLRRLVFRLVGYRFTWLDFYMRRKSWDQEKKMIWFMDQYQNPHEQKFTVGHVLDWFRQNGIDYVNSIPKINLRERLTMDERLFERHDPGTRLDHFLSQLAWIFTRGREGGFFIIIGQKH